MNPELILGTWRLVTCEARSADGRLTHPWGQGAMGYLIYTEDGYMSVSAMSADRALMAVAQEEGALDVFTSYCGKYEIGDGTITHHIEVALVKAWIGTSQIRFFALAGDRLTLTTPPTSAHGAQSVAQLVWERVGKRGALAGTAGRGLCEQNDEADLDDTAKQEVT
jgi:hypothetical protein